MGKLHKLEDAKIRSKALLAKRHGDGGGLYLQVGQPSDDRPSSKSWVFRYRVNGREREMGLGSYPETSLASAREKASACRRMRANNLDPLVVSAAERERERAEAARAITFKACCEAYVAAHEPSWHNAKHRQQWGNTLATYVHPSIGEAPVATVDTAAVTKVLEPIWRDKPETAGRVRGRIEAVLDWAKVRGYREGENPARWRGHLDQLLPARAKFSAVKHHAALPFEELPEFLASLRTREALAAEALQFLILTAARTGEVLGAEWSEFDLTEGTWTIPAARMKAAKEHRVPLSASALALLERVKPMKRGDGYVFPGVTKGKSLSNMALLVLLRRMKRTDITAHGFRSTFRDWAAERTNFPREVAEMALAHSVGDAVEAAYRRGDLFEKRRKLMDAWAKHCSTRPKREASADNVVRLDVRAG